MTMNRGGFKIGVFSIDLRKQKKGLNKPLFNIIDYIPALGGAGSSGLPAFLNGM